MKGEKKRPVWSGFEVTRRRFIAAFGASALTAMVGPRGAVGATEIKSAEETLRVTLEINGRPRELLVAARDTLLDVLRSTLGLTGTKPGCQCGECGTCTVLIDSRPRYACMTLAVEAEGRPITTVEGLMTGEELGRVQQAFAEEDAFQCGFCTSGQIMAVEGLLRRNPDPSREEIRMGVSGNLCRCGAYRNIFRAAGKAARPGGR